MNKEYDSIHQTGSGPGILYGSAKLHKHIIDNCPSFWPILSAIGALTYNFAKFLVPILSMNLQSTIHFLCRRSLQILIPTVSWQA